MLQRPRRARGFGRQRPELIGQILRWLAYRRGSPAHEPDVVFFLRRHPIAPLGLRLGVHQHPAQDTVDPEHGAAEAARNPCRTRPGKGSDDPLAPDLADHLNPPALCKTSTGSTRVHEGAEPLDSDTAIFTAVRHRW